MRPFVIGTSFTQGRLVILNRIEKEISDSLGYE
jgi:hypothetical protein